MKIPTLLATLALATTMPFSVMASDYPSKPVRVIVPYVAGGAADITARIISQKMSEHLGQTFVVENKAGANGMIGTNFVAKAPADGYTLTLTASGPLVVNPSLYEKTPYDPVADLAPISQITRYQYVLVVPEKSPITSVDDLIRQAKEKPNEVTFGSAGIGAGGHFAGELLSVMTNTKMTHVPYKGNAQALTDILSGLLTFTFDTVVTATPHIQTGKLRGYAVSGPVRAEALPDIPTMQELGYKGFDITQFQGLLAPAGTPADIIKKLREAVVYASRQPDVIQRLAKEGGNEIIAGTPEEFAAQIKSDLQRYRKLITDANIKAE